MAQKTRAEILTEINTLLADNTSGDISAEDVRSVLTDIKDSFVNLSDEGITTAEAAFLAGVTSAIQTQLNAKANLSGATFDGAVTIGDYTLPTTDGWQSQDYKEALLYITQTDEDPPTILSTIKNDFTNFAFTYISEGEYGFNSDEDLTTDTFAQFSNGKNLSGTLIQTLLPNNGTIVARSSDSSIENLSNANDVLAGYLYIRKYN
jgi:hypothetical protein